MIRPKKSLWVWIAAFLGGLLVLSAVYVGRYMNPSSTHRTGPEMEHPPSVLPPKSEKVEARMQYADALAEQGEQVRALEAYRRVIQMDSTYTPVYLRMAMLLADLGNMAEAIAACEHAIALDPSSLAAYNNLAALYGRMGRSALALDALDRALKVDSTYAIGFHNRGQVYYEMGQYAEAEADFRRSLRIDPTRAKVHRDLGRVYIDQQAYEQAAEEFEQALAGGVQGAAVHYYLAKAYGALGRTEAARMEYEQAIEADPDLPDAHYGLAMLLRREGKTSLADSQFAVFQRLRQEEGSPEVSRKLKTLRERVFQHPDDLAARFDLGDLLVKIGNLKAGQRAFEEVLVLQPRHVQAIHRLGHVYMLQKQPEEALEMYNRAIHIAPDQALSYLYAGDACLALGRSQEGIELYRSSLRKVPDNPLPWYHLGLGLMRTHRWVEADSIFSRGKKLAEGNRKVEAMFDRAIHALRSRAPLD